MECTNALKKQQGTVQQMLGWYQAWDLLAEPVERIIPQSSPLAVTVGLVVSEGSGLPFMAYV